MPGEMVNIEVEGILGETDKAFLVLLPDGREVWLPRSQISRLDVDQYEVGDADLSISVTDWIAQKLGLES